MKHKGTKVLIGAVAMSMLLTGSGFQTNAANLPAAGLGLAMADGSSVKDIRDEVKSKKESTSGSSQSQTESAEESSEASESAEEKETQSTEQEESEDQASEEESAQSTENESAEDETQQSAESAEAETETETETGTAKAKARESADTAKEKEVVEAVEPVMKETEVSDEETQEEQETLIIAQVNDYVNIRSSASTESEIVGKLYNNSVGVLIAEEDGWYQMKSGSVDGYVKAEYFKTGDEAKRIADEVGNRIATVNTQTLKVRYEASLEAPVLGLVPGGEELTVLDEENGFVKVSIEEGDGWVSMDYVILETEYVTAESVAEERARLEAEQKAKEEARKAAAAAEAKLLAEKQKKEEAQKAQEQQASAQDSEEEAVQEAISTSVASGASGLGAAVASFALQFVGNPYVYGGTSLTNGADCSGFVMSVYKNFGVSLPHSSSADRSVGYSVGSLAEAQPGDLVCYSGHVGIYIGNGQIVHASTASTGIKVSSATYRTPVAIRRIF